MAVLSESWWLDIISVIIAIALVFTSWVKWSYSYWHHKGISNPPTKFVFGNIDKLFTQQESFADLTVRLYDYFKEKKLRHGGFFLMLKPCYVPIDPEILKSIMQNDFNYFVDRGVYINEKDDPLSAHLFSLEGAKWRTLRAKLTPTFTSGKMKLMFETLTKCGEQLTEEMDKCIDDNPIDIKNILVRFTTDIIGNCAFGIECNSLKNPDNDFTKHMQSFFIDGFFENIMGFFSFILPHLAKKFKVKGVKPHISKFFMKVVESTVEYREKNNIYRKDFMHLLLQLKNRGKLVDDESVLKSDKDEKDNQISLTINELAAQAFVFFLAGFETSSTTMTFCLFELASNPDIQEKLKQEIKTVLQKHDNKVIYDAIMDMHYMDKVINETLRKYPPLPCLNRVCTEDYTIPETDIVLEKETKVLIPVLGIQRDPEYYPEPEKFDPERFSEENKRKRPPYTFIPFGEGPRICIGLRFGMMQTKVGLTYLLRNYQFSLSEKTSLPLKPDPKSFILSTKDGVWLNCTKV